MVVGEIIAVVAVGTAGGLALTSEDKACRVFGAAWLSTWVLLFLAGILSQLKDISAVLGG